MKKVVSFFVLFITFSAFAQVSYEGPEKGSIFTGVTVSTNDFGKSAQPVPNRYRTIIHLTPDFGSDPYLSAQPAGPEGSNYYSDYNISGVRDASDSSVIFSRFEGLDDPGNYIPPDTYLAAGPEHLILVDNSRFRITDKEGNTIQTIDADAWYGTVLPGANAFDPKVIYDQFDGRWVIVYLHINDATSEAYFLFSVSDDENPIGTWFNWAIPSNLNGNTPAGSWADYEGIGYDDKAVYLTSNQWTFAGSFQGAKLRIIDKKNIYIDENPGLVEWQDLWGITYPNTSNPAFGVRPVRMQSTTDDYYLVTTSPYQTGNDFGFFTITDPLGAPELTGTRVAVTAYSSPGSAKQPGGAMDLETGGSQLRNEPVYQNGTIYVVHSVSNSGSAVHYTAIDVDAGATINDLVFGLPGYYYFYPALAVSGMGDVLITFSRSSLDDYVSSYFAFIPSSTGFPDRSYVLNQGMATYEKTFGAGRNRWGDYNGAWTDPADNNVFWVNTEYAYQTNKWSNSVAGIRARPFETAYAYQINDDLDFGVANRYNDGETIRTRIANLGNTQLNLTSAQFGTNNFKITGVAFPVSIAPFDTLDIPIVFNPKELGVINDSLTIATNDVNKPELKVYLNGQGFSIAVKGTMYAVTGRGPGSQGELLAVNTETGEGTSLGESGVMPLMSVTINPVDTSLYALNTTVFTPSSIIKLNAFDGIGFNVIDSEVGVNAIAFDNDGTLFGFGKDNKLFTIDLNTGAGTEMGDIGFKVIAGTINPSDGTMWVSSGELTGKGDIYTIDKTTGLATLIGNAGLSETIYSLGFDGNGTLYGTTGNDFTQSVLYEISTNDASATEVGAVGEKGVLGLAFARDGVVSVGNGSEDEIVPLKFALEQNYPNPFNPSTVIRFTVPGGSDARKNVNLKVYDLLGRQVSVLVSGTKTAGNYSVTFNAENLPSGIYFYSLEIDGQRATKKMVLLR